MFEVGDKVVRVRNDIPDGSGDWILGPSGDIPLNVVVVVSHVCSWMDRGVEGIGIKVLGFTCFDCSSMMEGVWDAVEFRKLSDIQAENKAKRMEKLINSPLPKGNPLKKHFS